MKKNGITLIALVITIIILLILAGVAINLTINQGNLFNKANEAATKWNTAVGEESDTIMGILEEWENMTNKKIPGIEAEVLTKPADEDIVFAFKAGYAGEIEDSGGHLVEADANDTIMGYIVIKEGTEEDYELLFVGTGPMASRVKWRSTTDSYYKDFPHLSDISSVRISKGITTIGHGAFESSRSWFNSLISITIPETVVEIKGGAFAYSYSYIETVSIPSSVTTMGRGVFEYNTVVEIKLINRTSIPQEWIDINWLGNNSEVTVTFCDENGTPYSES